MNTSVTVSLANGRRVAFEVDQHGTGPAYFVLSVRKCGSSMLNIMCRFLASMNKRNLVLAGKFFDENVRENVWSPDPAICDLLYPGNVYADFRIMPTAFLPHPIFQKDVEFCWCAIRAMRWSASTFPWLTRIPSRRGRDPIRP